jgi:hypothetical protein
MGGGLFGGALAWLSLLVLAPDTSIDNAVGFMLIGLGLGSVAALMLSRKMNPRR